MCRQQQARQLAIASEATLENVRKVALAAARAWETQALDAENREAGITSSLSNEDAAIAQEFLLDETDDRRSIHDSA